MKSPVRTHPCRPGVATGRFRLALTNLLVGKTCARHTPGGGPRPARPAAPGTPGALTGRGHAVPNISNVLGLFFAGFLLAGESVLASSPVPPTTVLIVQGAAGADEFDARFEGEAAAWEAVADSAGAQALRLRPSGESPVSMRDRIRDRLAGLPAGGLNPLWLVLIGHGTFDGHEARFNLPGPDLTASDLAAWLDRFTRPLIVINTTAASAPFLPKLAGTNRVIITATRSGYEQSYAHFGEYLAGAIRDPEADLDQDGQTSVLEAFLSAAAGVKQFYAAAGRLASEHALIDDNGDGLGTPAEWFRGLRATRKAAEGKSLDGRRAHQLHLVYSPEEARLTPEQRTRRDALEQQVFALRGRKGAIPAEDYYARLESLLLDLARLYREVGASR